MYLERRRRRWYALLAIPLDLREPLGKVRFVQSLDTEDRATAERRAAILGVRWQSDIQKARRGTLDHIERDALFWKKVLEEAPEPEREIVHAAIGDEAREMVDRTAAKAGFVDEREPGYDDLPVHSDAQKFVAIATGKIVRFGDHLDEYLATLTGNKPKTVDQKRSTVEDFAGQFHHTGDVHRKEVQKWVNRQVQDGQGVNTVQRYLSELRGYWRYLQSIEVVPEDALPFDKLTVPKPAKNGNSDTRQPFEAKDVVKLWRKAKADKDQELADLIELDMWTGARIEDLCGLKTAKIGRGYFDITDAKTEAGIRRVPIHPKLAKTVARLVKASKDGYLLSGLTENKYGDRSNAIGKRFGRMKTDMGFGPQFVFHSIRKTVATQFENAKVPEGVAADIIGHDKPTMTYGLYSGGASMETKRRAILRLRYPG